MPRLDDSIVAELEIQAKLFLNTSGGYSELEFLSAGGSAAVFKVSREDGARSALKAYDPTFLSGVRGAAERRRLEVQSRLIGHQCASLVQTQKITEANGTAFVEMELIEWPQLTGKPPMY